MNAPAKEYDGVNKYIRITDIDENSSEYSCANIVSPDGELLDKYLVKENDILFARTGSSTGKTYLYRHSDGHLYFAGFLIRANINVCNDSNFIYLQCKLKRYRNWVRIMSARSGQPGINSQEYSTYTIYTTNKAEQIKISSLFKLLDERIATQRRLIEDLKKLKSAIYDKVFQSIKGKSVPLEDVADIIKGKQVNGEFLTEFGDYYVMNGGIEPSGYYHTFNVSSNTISISEGGNSCGYIQWNSIPFWSGGHCYTLNIKDASIRNKYLYHFLKWCEADIMKLRIGTGLPNIQKKDLAKVTIEIPTSSLQTKIIYLLDSYDAKIENEIYVLELYNHQKLFLLSQMFI